MKLNRKVIALILAISMSLSVLTTGAFAAENTGNPIQSLDSNQKDSAVSIAVMSDIHIGRSGAAAKVSHALEEFYKAEPNLNAIVAVGDLTDNGYTQQYETLKNIVADKVDFNKTKLAASMGNHEFYNGLTPNEAINRYENELSPLGMTVNSDTVVKGYHIIGFSASDQNGDYSGDYDWLKGKLEAAKVEDPNKPIILMSHHGMKNTAYVTNEWYGNYGEGTEHDIKALLKQYPQVIHFSGHSHAPLNDPRSIYQDDNFTAIQTSTVGAYFENESGKMEGVYPAESNTASQALMLEVGKDNVVTIRRMDLTSGQYIGKPWVIATPKLVMNDSDAFTYTTAKRTEASSIPTFAEDASVKVNSVTGNSVNFTFTQGLNKEGIASDGTGNDDAFIHSYRIKILDSADNEIANKLTFSDFGKIPMASALTKEVSGLSLQPNETYHLEVYAINPFQKESTTSIMTTFSVPEYITNEEVDTAVIPKANILDVDFKDGTNLDKASNIVAKLYGAGVPQISNNQALNKNVASFSGFNALGYAFTDTQYDKMKNTSTLECMFYLNAAPSSGYVDIVGNMDASGQGFEYTSNHVLQYWLRIGNTYYMPQADNIEPNQWVHAVATYNNSKVELYINGILTSTKEVTGDITHPSGSARVFCVGADVSYNGSFESPANVQISTARVYGNALTKDEIYKLYQQESNTQISVPTDASFKAKLGSSYTIPAATATNAVKGQLEVTVSVTDHFGKNITLKNNQFTPLLIGDYTINYRANKMLYTKTLSVTENGGDMETIVVLDKTMLSLTTGQSGTLTAAISPTGSDTISKWESSNPEVATVDKNGRVTTVKAGTTVITVTTAKGKTASCTIIVMANSSSDNGSSHHHSKSSSSRTFSTSSSAQNSVKIYETAAGGTAAAVTTTLDSSPIITGNKSNVSVTVPSDVSSVITSATAGKPADVKITMPNTAIVEQLQNSAVQTVALTIRMPSVLTNNSNANATVVINAEQVVLQAAKDAKKDIVLTVVNSETGKEAYSWTFKAVDLANSTAVKDVNIAMSIHATTAVPTVNAVTQNNNGIVIGLANNGVLPSTATIRMNVADQGYKAGQTFYFYAFNPTTHKLEMAGNTAYKVGADGYVSVTITYCSTYVLLQQAARSLTLDTLSYKMAPKGSYEIGVKLTSAQDTTVKVYSSSRGVTTVTKLKNGNYRVTGAKAGVTYIMFDVFDKNNQRIAHASVKITVQNGVKPNGNSRRQVAIF